MLLLMMGNSFLFAHRLSLHCYFIAHSVARKHRKYREQSQGRCVEHKSLFLCMSIKMVCLLSPVIWWAFAHNMVNKETIESMQEIEWQNGREWGRKTLDLSKIKYNHLYFDNNVFIICQFINNSFLPSALWFMIHKFLFIIFNCSFLSLCFKVLKLKLEQENPHFINKLFISHNKKKRLSILLKTYADDFVFFYFSFFYIFNVNVVAVVALLNVLFPFLRLNLYET